MPSEKQEKGREAEDIAAEYLLEKGYELLDQQWHCRYGELDLVMKDQDELVFVEVKMRSQLDYGYPEDMVSMRKASCLKKSAWKYLEQYDQLDSFWRFDIVAITSNTQKHELHHIEDALRND